MPCHAVKEQAYQMQELERELDETRSRIVPLLPGTQLTTYDFPIRAKHSDLGREYFLAKAAKEHEVE